MQLRLNQALLDWFTVGSYEASFYKYWDMEIERRRLELMQKRYERRMLKRYPGTCIDVATGGLFLGTSSQKLGFHNVAVAMGEAADLCRLSAWYSLENHNARCSRLDVQMTIIQPAEWEQLRFFNRCQLNTKRVSTYEESLDIKGKKMVTVYVGSKTSDRFVRVYQKKSDDGLLLRFEGQFGDGQATLLARQLLTRKVTELDTIAGLLAWVGDKKLMDAFKPHLTGGIAQLPKYTRQDTKTDEWLLTQVLPVLFRRLQAHDCSEVLRERFADVVNDGKIVA